MLSPFIISIKCMKCIHQCLLRDLSVISISRNFFYILILKCHLKIKVSQHYVLVIVCIISRLLYKYIIMTEIENTTRVKYKLVCRFKVNQSAFDKRDYTTTYRCLALSYACVLHYLYSESKSTSYALVYMNQFTESIRYNGCLTVSYAYVLRHS